MVKLLKENHAVYDAYGVILDMTNGNPWIIYTSEPMDAKRLKSYLNGSLDDLVSYHKTPEGVVKYIQNKFSTRFYDVAPVPFDMIEDWPDMVHVNRKYISVLEYYDLDDYM